VVGTNVTDGPNKIYIGSIPPQLTDDNVKEILSAFGQLKAFNLVRDPGSVLSKGYAFCEYTDSSLTQVAIEGLNGLPVADKQLQVRVANLSAKAQQAQAQAQQSHYLPGGNMAAILFLLIIIFYFILC
jgi:RNA recognition motif-containing protein